MSGRALESLIAVHGHGESAVSYCPACGNPHGRTLVRCGEAVLPVGPYPYPGSLCLRHAALARVAS